MKADRHPGLLRRIGAALRRSILGRSSHDCTGRFTHDDEYWDRVIAAQAGWPRLQSPKPAVDSREILIPTRADIEECPVRRVPAQMND